MWNFPHCVAALDGKHCALRCPPKTGSLHFNWKHSFSIVLLAAVDAKIHTDFSGWILAGVVAALTVVCFEAQHWV